jgi:prepilin-type N-terminal cleavage/methylation domain-containing protein
MRSTKAFTLIELLIVVAIIAILAAIAVPNFLEAQVRSKIGRAQADMRTIATALESYLVDHNRYPMGFVTIRQAVNTSKVETPPFPSSKYDRNPYAQARLTTPVAYLSSILRDPFTSGSFNFDRTDDVRGAEPFPYWYDDYQTWEWFAGATNGYPYDRFEDIARMGYRYSLSSAGPERSQMMMWYALDGVPAPQANNHVVYAYDPSNGTVSEGFVARTNKGVFKEVNQRQ